MSSIQSIYAQSGPTKCCKAKTIQTTQLYNYIIYQSFIRIVQSVGMAICFDQLFLYDFFSYPILGIVCSYVTPDLTDVSHRSTSLHLYKHCCTHQVPRISYPNHKNPWPFDLLLTTDWSLSRYLLSHSQVPIATEIFLCYTSFIVWPMCIHGAPS